MKIVIEIDADTPPSREKLQKAFSWLQWMIDNHPGGTETIVDQDLPAASMTGAAVAQAFAPAQAAQFNAPPPAMPDSVVRQAVDPMTTPPTEAAPRAASPAGLELDSTGAPWSDRVCASTKKQNADGTWTKRKGVDVALYNQVMTEGRALVGSPATAATSTPPAPPAPANVPPPPPAGNVPPPPPASNVPPPPPAGNVPPPPPVTDGAPSDGVLAAVQAITNSIVEGKITMPELAAQCILHGHANLSDLQNDARALGTVCAHFKQAGKL